MAVTISAHNGSQVARDHNTRNPKIVGKEKHIDPNGVSEIWHDEKPQEAYKRLFGAAMEKYNAKQKRADRRITDYYKAICEDKKKHAVYEMIVAIGNRENTIDAVLGYKILRKFVDGWSDRNPNLELIGAYYHADEEGVPHVHLDYIPVAHGYNRGMETQSALVKALEQQAGFEKNGKETAQIQWQRRENAHLEKLCYEIGIEVEHPLIADRKHLDTDTYKAQQDLQSTQKDLVATEKKVKAAEKKLKVLKQPTDLQDWLKTLTPQKSLTGGVKGISFEDVMQLIRELEDSIHTALKYLTLQSENKKLKAKLEQYENKSKQAPSLIDSLKKMKEEDELRENAAAFRVLPEEIQRMARDQLQRQRDSERTKKVKKSNVQER